MGGVIYGSLFTDGHNAFLTVGAEDEFKDFGNGVVKRLAIIGSGKIAIGTGGKILVHAAGAYLAPVGRGQLLAARTLARGKLSAGRTIKPAISNQIGIILYWL